MANIMIVLFLFCARECGELFAVFTCDSILIADIFDGRCESFTHGNT